jgi:hypothetical protein
MRVAGTVLLGVGFVMALAIVIAYGTLTRWERRPVGRMIMALVFEITAVQGLSLAARIFGEYPGRAILALLLYASFVVTLGWMLSQIIREQLRVRRGKDRQ